MKVTDFIVCDDIRREHGEKISLMGVLDREISLTTPGGPGVIGSMRLGVLIRADLEPNEAAASYQFSVRREEDVLANTSGPIVPGDRRRVRFVAVSEGLKISAPGLLRIELILRDESTKVVGVASHEIRITEVTRSAAT